MIIILSGIDKVGKTTLARQISKETGLPYVKFNPPKSLKVIDPLLWSRDVVIFHRTLLEYFEKLVLSREKVGVIFDRFYPDEIVYSKIFRGLELKDIYRDIDERFAKLNTILLYLLHPDFIELKRRWETETKVSFEKTRLLIHEFEQFYQFTSLKKFRISGKTPLESFRAAKSVIDNSSPRQLKLNEAGN